MSNSNHDSTANNNNSSNSSFSWLQSDLFLQRNFLSDEEVPKHPRRKNWGEVGEQRCAGDATFNDSKSNIMTPLTLKNNFENTNFSF